MKKIKFFVLVIALFNVFTSYSQVSKDTVNVVKLNDVEVVGIRPDIKTPISQKVVNSVDIDKQYSGQEMVYILDKTPSITSQSDGGQPNGYVSFRIRGIDQTRINMTLNGIPLNESEDQGVYFSNFPNFAMNINSMQIQRGIGTSANGTSSYGGSINFESKTGLDKGFNASFTSGSFGTQSLNVNFGTGLINKFALFGSVSEYTSDGYKYNSSGSGYSAFLSGGYYGNKDVLKLTAFSGKSINQMAWYAVSESDILKDPRTNYNPKGENDDFNQSFVQLQYVHSESSNYVLTNTFFYNHLDGKWGMFTAPTDLLNFGLNSNFVGFTSNYLIKYNDLKFNTGFQLNTYNRTHSGNMTHPGSVQIDSLYTNTGYKNEGSFYIKANYDINKFSLFTDLQLRNVNFTYIGDNPMKRINWLFLNPRGGVTYTITNNESLYFSVGQSHREPTRSDMFGGNDNLVDLFIIKPESVIDYELGYNLSNSVVKLQSNLFYMDFNNEITQLGAMGLNSLPLMTDVDKSSRYGAEFDFSCNLTKNLSINNNTTLMNSEIKGDNTSYHALYTPNVIVNQNIEYNNGKLFINVSGRYLSDAFINPANTETIPGYVLFNAKIGYQLTKNVNLSIQGNNLTNTKYFTGGYVSNGENAYFIGAPLNFYTTVKVKF